MFLREVQACRNERKYFTHIPGLCEFGTDPGIFWCEAKSQSNSWIYNFVSFIFSSCKDIHLIIKSIEYEDFSASYSVKFVELHQILSQSYTTKIGIMNFGQNFVIPAIVTDLPQVKSRLFLASSLLSTKIFVFLHFIQGPSEQETWGLQVTLSQVLARKKE